MVAMKVMACECSPQRRPTGPEFLQSRVPGASLSFDAPDGVPDHFMAKLLLFDFEAPCGMANSTVKEEG